MEENCNAWRSLGLLRIHLGNLAACRSYSFFFQAEDGIRDVAVTGVQTCALPICRLEAVERVDIRSRVAGAVQAVHFREGALVKQGDLLITIDPAPYAAEVERAEADRKSTRLNSSHGYISYAVFCLKKKKKATRPHTYFTQSTKFNKSPTSSHKHTTQATRVLLVHIHHCSCCALT